MKGWISFVKKDGIDFKKEIEFDGRSTGVIEKKKVSGIKNQIELVRGDVEEDLIDEVERFGGMRFIRINNVSAYIIGAFLVVADYKNRKVYTFPVENVKDYAFTYDYNTYEGTIVIALQDGRVLTFGKHPTEPTQDLTTPFEIPIDGSQVKFVRGGCCPGFYFYMEDGRLFFYGIVDIQNGWVGPTGPTQETINFGRLLNVKRMHLVNGKLAGHVSRDILITEHNDGVVRLNGSLIETGKDETGEPWWVFSYGELYTVIGNTLKMYDLITAGQEELWLDEGSQDIVVSSITDVYQFNGRIIKSTKTKLMPKIYDYTTYGGGFITDTGETILAGLFKYHFAPGFNADYDEMIENIAKSKAHLVHSRYAIGIQLEDKLYKASVASFRRLLSENIGVYSGYGIHNGDICHHIASTGKGLIVLFASGDFTGTPFYHIPTTFLRERTAMINVDSIRKRHKVVGLGFYNLP